MLDLSQKMEISFKVNQFIKKANEALNLNLHQPNITYKLTDSTNVAQVTGCTINFNNGLVNIIDEDIERQVAHVINFELNHVTNDDRSETYVNIVQLLKGKSDIITSIKKTTPKPKQVIKKKTSSIKEKAISVYENAIKNNNNITRQEIIVLITKAFELEADPKGKMKASNYYTTAKKFVEK